jgi:carboxylate/amino acid/amine transporter
MLYLLIASLIWAFSFGLIKTNLTSIDPNIVSFIRLAISLLIFLPLIKMNSIRSKHQSHKVRRQLLLIGAIQFGLMYATYIYSFHFLKAYEVALFTILTPIYVTLLNDLINKKPLDLPALTSALIAVLGAGYIVYSKMSDNIFLIGVILVQASNVCFAIGQIYYKKLMNKYSDLQSQDVFGFLYAGGAGVALILSFISGGWNNFYPTGEQISALIYLGVIASGVGFFLWNLGAVKAKVSSLAAMNNAKIPLAVLCSIFIFQESADWKRLLIGGSIMIIAVIISEQEKIKSRWPFKKLGL